MKRHLTIAIDSNKKTCGKCQFLRRWTSASWYCRIWDLGLESATPIRTPNRIDLCLKAEAAK